MSTVGIRSEIHQIVSTMMPLDAIEEKHIRFVLDWIESGSEIFRIEKPATPETHLVCYFVIATPEMDRILLVDHKLAKLWLPPGGHVDPGEDPKETVRREAKEELGIDSEFLFDEPLLLTVTKTVGNVAKHTDVSLWYLLKGDQSQVLDYDPNEFHQIRWFGIDEIPFEKSDPHMKRFVEKMLREQTWKSYESSALDYAKNVDGLHPQKEAERFLSLIPSGGTIIDIGCGSGRDAKNFSEKGFRVTGIDFSPNMIEIAKRNAPKATFKNIDMHSLDLEDTFDAAWANASLLHIPKARFLEVLEKIYSLLNDNGLFYIKMKQGSHEGIEKDHRYDNLPKFFSYFEEDELKEVLREAGFELLDVFTTKKESSYQTHPFVIAFCKKSPGKFLNNYYVGK
jgi:8-oxo-dGTP pyrophosphatase MutT (NUDIX family)/predicted O-methyltransferase YrrM